MTACLARESVQVFSAVAPRRSKDQDRIKVIYRSDSALLVLADGATGPAGGAQAADMAVDFFERWAATYADAPTSDGLVSGLVSLDREVTLAREAGHTTCVVAVVRDGQVIGASAGDSSAWLVGPDGIRDLTAKQAPMRIGTGVAYPVAFGPCRLDGTLLIASDGLFHFARPAFISEVIRSHEPDAAVKRLVSGVTLGSGDRMDDVSVILVAGNAQGSVR